MAKRKVDIAIISDVHLGTYGCRAKELVMYLRSIRPDKLILNGDIIDIWQFRKSYWPDTHMKVLQQLMKMVAKGVKVYYLTGNHDELLRRFSGFELGNFELKDKLILDLDGKQTWFFHGDIFDVTMKYSKWLAKLGAVGYDLLIVLNRLVNYVLEKMGREKYSFSKKIKDSVKKAVAFVDDFERTAMDIAIQNKYGYVVCGHIHKPNMRHYSNENGSVIYLNSGDWVESLTALEYNEGEWGIYRYMDDDAIHSLDHMPEKEPSLDNSPLAALVNGNGLIHEPVS